MIVVTDNKITTMPIIYWELFLCQIHYNIYYLQFWQQSYSCFTDDKTNIQKYDGAHPKTLLLHRMQTQEGTLKSVTIISTLYKKLNLQENYMPILGTHPQNQGSLRVWLSFCKWKTWPMDSSSTGVKSLRPGGRSVAELWLIRCPHKTNTVFLCSCSESCLLLCSCMAPCLPS